jgi:hypothetical protein
MSFKPKVRLIQILLLLITLSCGSSKKKTFDFGAFEITGPKNWNVVKVQGIDSYVRMVITKSNDTLHFDYGYYSNPLEEKGIFVHSSNSIPWFIENDIDTTGFHFIEKDTITSEDRLVFLKQETTFELIDGFKAKIVSPKNTGEGLTGVYFDSLGSGPIGNFKLNFVGYNLDIETEEELLIAIRTMQFEKQLSTSDK